MTQDPPSPAPTRRPLAVWAAALLAVLAVGAGVWLVTATRDAVPHPNEAEPAGPPLPPNTSPEPGTREVGGRGQPEVVVFDRANQRVRFHLVVPSGPAEPFYVMEARVWYSLYASLRYPEPGLPTPIALSGPDDPRGRAPVTDLTGQQARKFVNYAFGGDLPSADEWDGIAKRFGTDGGREWLFGDGGEWPLRGGADGPPTAAPATVVPGAGFRVVLKVPK